MKKLTKWLIGTLIAGAIITGSIIPAKQKEDPPKKESIVIEKTIAIERTINFDNPQITLNDAFNLCKPENLSEVIYDPDFKKSDEYVKKRLIGYSRRLTDEYIKQSRTEATGHDLCIIDILAEVGNGKKRIAFGREGISKSLGINSIEDLASCIFHEDVHAKESRYGYNFGNRIIQGKELMELFEKGEIRTNVIRRIGEFDAYFSMIERAEKTEKKPSSLHLINMTTKACQVYSTIESDVSIGALTQLEKDYAEEKLNRHKGTIENLKNFNSKN